MRGWREGRERGHGGREEEGDREGEGYRGGEGDGTDGVELGRIKGFAADE